MSRMGELYAEVADLTRKLGVLNMLSAMSMHCEDQASDHEVGSPDNLALLRLSVLMGETNLEARRIEQIDAGPWNTVRVMP